MSSEVQKLLPNTRGLLDSRAEREYTLAFMRMYSYFDQKLNDQKLLHERQLEEQSKTITTQTQLVNSFATQLIGITNPQTNTLAQLGQGSVSSVDISVPTSIFGLAGNPITNIGQFVITLLTKAKNTVWAGPTTGANAAPTFRLLISSDMPRTSSAADPSTTELPNSGDSGVHKNNTSGFIYFAYNNSGTIVKVQLV